MTLQEVKIWGAYRYKYGPLNPVRKYDQPSALVAAQVNNAHGGKAKPKDFMPYGKEEEEEIEVSGDEFANALILKGAKVGR